MLVGSDAVHDELGKPAAVCLLVVAPQGEDAVELCQSLALNAISSCTRAFSASNPISRAAWQEEGLGEVGAILEVG